ncbi:MAG: uroporphyrinogen-III synthase [Acidimicrobiales bacterium]
MTLPDVVSDTASGVITAPDLTGFSVGVTADHRRVEQAEALERHGVRVVFGPVVRSPALNELEALEAAIDATLARPPDVVVFTSGLGVEGWLSAAESLGRDQALTKLLGAARLLTWGGAIDAAYASGLEVGGVAPEGDVEAMLALVAAAGAGAGERRVAVQTEGGSPSPDSLVGSLRTAGVEVVGVPVPPSVLPDDPQPALDLIAAVVDRRVDAVTFTAAAEVRNLVELAISAGSGEEVRSALAGDVIPACVGRACADAAARAGMAGVVVPERARIGAMVQSLVARLEAAAVGLRLEGVEVVLRGALTVVGGEKVWLAERERALLAALARRPGAVVAKAELLRQVWRSDGVDGAEGHAVEVTVARLRRRLGPAGAGIQSVSRRGYRLAPG